MTSILFNNFSIMVIGIIGICILYFCHKGCEVIKYKDLLIVTTIAFAFMLIMYAGLVEKYREPYYASDDKSFEFYGHLMFEKNIFSFRKIPYISGMYYAKGYLIVIAWIEKISSYLEGYSTISPRILNIYFWLATSVLALKKLDNSMIKKRSVKTAFFVLTLFPNALYISSFVYRDVFIVFLIVVSIYNFEKLTNSFKHKNFCFPDTIRLPIIFFCLYALYYSRKQMLYVIMVIFIASFFEEKLKRENSLKLLAVAVMAVVGLLLLQVTGGIELLTVMQDGYSSYLTNQSNGLSKIIFSMPLLPFGVIARFLFGLVSPFPAAIFSLDYVNEPLFSLLMASTCLGTVFQIFLLPYLNKGVKKLDYNAIKFLGVFLPIILTTFTFRHFVMAYPFAAPILVQQIGTTGKVEKKNNIVYVLLLMMFAATAYLLLKII